MAITSRGFASEWCRKLLPAHPQPAAAHPDLQPQGTEAHRAIALPSCAPQSEHPAPKSAVCGVCRANVGRGKGMGRCRGRASGGACAEPGYDHRRGRGECPWSCPGRGKFKVLKEERASLPGACGSPAPGPALAADGEWSRRMLEPAEEGWELTAWEQMRHDSKGGDNLTGLA